jgi:phenylacetate-CoA ligase
MLDTAIAQMRVAVSIATGRRLNIGALDRLLDGMLATNLEFGAIGAEGAQALGGPPLDEKVRQHVALRRFRSQARRAAAQTRYYGSLFSQHQIDPATMGWDDVRRLPITGRDDLREQPDAFVCAGARPVMRAITTGTTGAPSGVWFSAYELAAITGATANHVLLRNLIRPDDIVQMCISSRAHLPLMTISGTCFRIGAVMQVTGLVDPALALAQLTERRAIPGKRRRITVMNVYPSYFGELVEHGLRLGYRPHDFDLERVLIGGEIVTAGLLARAQRLFGPIAFAENYASTEMVPCGGIPCTAGHLHFESSAGLHEVVAFDGTRPAADGEPGLLVETPFPPYRETTMLLRYDTEDIVAPLSGPVDCELRNIPATSHVLGKRRLAVRHDDGWVFQRDIMEALEGCEAVPLPARYSCRAVPTGVALQVHVREDEPAVESAIRDRLAEHGVPVRQLALVTDPARLTGAVPLRSDLRERSFTPLPQALAVPPAARLTGVGTGR